MSTSTSTSSSEMATLYDRLSEVPTALPVAYIPLSKHHEWIAVWREDGEVHSVALGTDVQGYIAQRIEMQKQRFSDNTERFLSHTTIRQIQRASARRSYRKVAQTIHMSTHQLRNVPCIRHATFHLNCEYCLFTQKGVTLRRLREGRTQEEEA